MYSEITRKFEFDSGHRVPNHASKCRNVHGHRYVLHVTVGGELVDVSGASDEGMVVDFGELKTRVNAALVDRWDHGFLVWEHDPFVFALNAMKDHKTIVMPLIPTVENLAAIAFQMLDIEVQHWASGRVHLIKLRLYETPNCWADCVTTAQVRGHHA